VIHELVVAPAAALLALLLLEAAIGLRRALVQFLALVGYGFGLELAAIAVFRSHDYGDAWRLAPLGVPLAIAVVWASVIPAAIAVAGRLGYDSPLRSAFAAAFLATALDLLIEPVAVRLGLWRWTPPGPWLGVPIGNFVGWGVIVSSYAWGAARGGASGSLRAQALRRVGLAAASIGCLVAVGLVWRAASAEALFAARGSLVVAAVLATVLTLRFARREPTETLSFPRLLGAAPRGYALGVFALLLATFSAGAVRVAETPLVVIALLVSSVLLVTLDATRT
jgi:uncharacterized membrane protein